MKEAVVCFVFLFRLFSWLVADSVMGRDGGEKGRDFVDEKNGYASIEEELSFFFFVWLMAPTCFWRRWFREEGSVLTGWRLGFGLLGLGFCFCVGESENFILFFYPLKFTPPFLCEITTYL